MTRAISQVEKRTHICTVFALSRVEDWDSRDQNGSVFVNEVISDPKEPQKLVAGSLFEFQRMDG